MITSYSFIMIITVTLKVNPYYFPIFPICPQIINFFFQVIFPRSFMHFQIEQVMLFAK